MKELEVLFEQYTRQKPDNIYELPSSGSNRRYFRITGSGMSLIGAKGLDVAENIAFMEIAKHFRLKGLPVPQVLCASKDNMFYLQEDLGDITLFNTIQQGRETSNFSPDEVALLKKTISTLPKLQFEGGKGLDYSICFPQPEFDERNVWFDCNYFKYCFLKPSGLEFNEVLLQDDFERFAADLLTDDTDTFLYRDFNARNVMVKDGELYFIDFQGGRRGPIYYDIASFVWQARARFPKGLQSRMVEAYKDALREIQPFDEVEFNERLRLFRLFRLLQVMGAYGFRGWVEHKANFVTSIPAAVEALAELLEQPFEAYPYLTETLRRMVALPRFKEESVEEGRLEVKVYSFSFKKGIPQDPSGNGGGYVFDCRSIHNPGRYEPYKKLTGRDEPVIRFLEDDGEITGFLGHIYSIVDSHVETYRSRGFSNLMVSFGCTGGQHRSVYSAEHVAHHIAEKYPDVRVRLIHREQNISETYN